MKKMSTNSGCDILSRLYEVVLDRRRAPSEKSYVASLLQEGAEKIHAKIAEESGEVLDASHRGSRTDIIHETADLWFHCIVLLGHHGIAPADIYRELERRWGTSGLEEKAGRSRQDNP